MVVGSGRCGTARRVLVVGIGVMTIMSGCGKTSEDEPAPRGGASGHHAGSEASATAGLAGAGRFAGGSAGLGVAGEATDSGGNGSGGNAGGRAGILAPLDTDDATLAAASGAELLTLAMEIGYARGWAMCTCIAPQPLPEEALPGCAEAETSYEWLYQQPGRAQCLLEKARSVPGFDERLRCRARLLRADGNVYAACADGQLTRSTYVGPDCAENEAADAIIGGRDCSRAFLCADGARFDEGQCDLKLDCEDGADERGCGAVKCGDTLVDRYDACDPEKCAAFDPPLCELHDLRLFCGDGQEFSVGALCDGEKNCATGRDEQYCY